MALRTYVRLSDGQKVTLDDTYVTDTSKNLLSDLPNVEIPKAIKAKKNEGSKHAD